MTFTLTDILIGVAGLLATITPWIGIYLQGKSVKREQEKQKVEDLQKQTAKEVKVAEEKGRHDQHQEQTDKEIGAIWSELTQHGSKIQVVEIVTANLSQKMDLMMDILKEIKVKIDKN